mmetsp:Transcript_23773/g.24232  ORF Transcript_23773/g.24232 Transcript_23773/m.24232 type:complete len:124 (-) Transcript_23773:59-430(-)
MGFLVDSFVGRDIGDFDPVISLSLLSRTNPLCTFLVQIEPQIPQRLTLRGPIVPFEDLRQTKVLGCRFAACRQFLFSIIAYMLYNYFYVRMFIYSLLCLWMPNFLFWLVSRLFGSQAMNNNIY